MKLKEIPDLPANKYVKRLSLAVPVELHSGMKSLKEMGKDPAEFARLVLLREIRKVLSESTES